MSQPVIPFTRGVPPAESFPKEKLAECATAALTEYGDEVLQYAPARGFRPLRALIAGETGAHEDQVILGQGSLQLLDLLARMLVRPGDVAYTEEPSYDRAITVLRRAGARALASPSMMMGRTWRPWRNDCGAASAPSSSTWSPTSRTPAGP